MVSHTHFKFNLHLVFYPLRCLEEFEKFLKFMVEKFKYKSFVTSDWKACLYEFFKDKVCRTFT